VTARKKALVLSGGGGRGAYHVGVIEALVRYGWMEDGRGPDILAGTSIGAINAAALASGLTVEQLKTHWRAMRTESVQRLSSDIPAIGRPLLRFLLRSVLTSDQRAEGEITLPVEERSMSAGSLLDRFRTLFYTRDFHSLLDTSPWRQTLGRWMDFARINGPAAPALLLAATELQTGTLRIFCNRELAEQPRDTIGLDHLMASSSIPIVYPWTEIGAQKYWDGAVLANTPLEPVIELAGDDDVEIIVVMMSPWHAEPAALRAQAGIVPKDLVQALTLTLDWALLASYRVAFEMLEHRNRLAQAAELLDRAAQQTGDASMRLAGRRYPQITTPLVIAPKELMPLEWIVDYELDNHERLFAIGFADATAALMSRQ
jgi:NTE family protein